MSPKLFFKNESDFSDKTFPITLYFSEISVCMYACVCMHMDVHTHVFIGRSAKQNLVHWDILRNVIDDFIAWVGQEPSGLLMATD